jgi:hypothetical protein
VGPVVRARASAQLFTDAKDREDFIIHLSKGINAVFGAAKQFYLANRRTPVKVEAEDANGQAHGSWHRKESVDVPTFFKRRGLHIEFARFWKRTEARKRFERVILRFEDAVRLELNS